MKIYEFIKEICKCLVKTKSVSMLLTLSDTYQSYLSLLLPYNKKSHDLYIFTTAHEILRYFTLPFTHFPFTCRACGFIISYTV